MSETTEFTIENLEDTMHSELSRWHGRDAVFHVEGEGSPGERTKRYRLHTDSYVFHIRAVEREGGSNYLGCVVSCRKSRVGEDWHRGSDLADGDLSLRTWRKIKNDIIAYSLRKE